MEQNHVVMSLEDYNTLLLENRALKAKLNDILTIKKTWNDELEVVINRNKAEDLLKQKFVAEGYASNYELKDFDDIGFFGNTIANKKPEEAEDEVANDEQES
jgi:hypothetical protein